MSNPTDLPGVSQWPEPVTLERVRQAATAAGLDLQPAENDRLRARWGENLIEVALGTDKATVLRILGLSAATVPKERAADVATFVNNWHRERVWPTLMWTGTSEGTLNLRSVFTHDLTAGATDAQLAASVRLGLGVSAKGLDAVREALSRGTTEPGPA